MQKTRWICVFRFVEKLRSANIEKTPTTPNDEEKEGGEGLEEGWNIREQKNSAGKQSTTFPANSCGVICPILSSRNDDDRPGAGGAIITSLGCHPSASPQLRSITITIIVARRCRRYTRLVLTEDKFLISRINWLDCNCRCACYTRGRDEAV